MGNQTFIQYSIEEQFITACLIIVKLDIHSFNNKYHWLHYYLISVNGKTNKATYMTALVAYGWAGAVTQVKSPLSVFSDCVKDRPTDQPTE